VRRRAAAAILAAAALAIVPAGAQGGGGHHHARVRVFVNGDSLAVGTAPYLPGDLARYRLTQSASISRHAPEGVDLVRHFPGKLPRIIVMQLGTNDDPGATSDFRSAVRSTIHIAGPGRCVVWVNIVRPPVGGNSYAGYNRILSEENRDHPTFRVVKWTHIVASQHLQLSADGVHPTASGYQVRAKAIAQQVRRCN